MPTCQRCEEPAVLTSRKQPFCKDCFIKFIRGKQRKVVQSLNIKDKIVDVLVPISFDLSNTSYVSFNNAIVLLDILINFSKSLYKSYFKITMLFLVTAESSANIKSFYTTLKERYQFTNIDIKILDLMAFIRNNESLYNINVHNNRATSFPSVHKFESFEDYISSITNTSTREDLLFNIHWTVIKIFAYLHNFPTVLYSNSMGNIATKILSNIVKGKGIEISQILEESQTLEIADDEKKQFSFQAFYPLKDVLNTEIFQYIKLLNLTDLLPSDLQRQYEIINDEETGSNNKILNVKTATLNQLINEYFNDLEKNGYSTIVSTVVSTGSKLAIPKGELKECPLCGFKMPGGASKWLDHITVNSPCEDGESPSPSSSENHNPQLSGNPLDICYGCLVSFDTAGEKFSWPIAEPVSMSEKEILNEYIISDDDDE
ncbi:Ncs2 protein [Saccharomycopsis crataegensis]|uniref:Cytoplasmic tRNA 2-thiolation protein 2 n=1 Tax=Saccharomycopsis crataegensis TaxID=43959 RepID=A0AAV5QJ21_9ASCO|nr:Ncs2 protein [Saccharomycopsis crataegensis]